MRPLPNKIFYLILSVAMALVAASCDSDAKAVSTDEVAASLCDEITANRYKNLALMEAAALQMDTLCGATMELQCVAKNALGHIALMRMDYSAAEKYYLWVIKESPCEVERLVADVGLMTVCYRTSANKSFFDYRSSAIRRVRRINEEVEMLLPHDKRRFTEAKVELAAVSLCYFANLGMDDEVNVAAAYLEKNRANAESPAQRLYGRMILNYSAALPVVERAETLFNVHRRSLAAGEKWLAANSKLMLSVLLRSDEARKQVASAMSSQLIELSRDTLGVEQLPYKLSLSAVEEFMKFGDTYMAIEAMAVAASCATQQGEYDKALALLNDAILQINNYYDYYYPNVNLPSLVLYDVDEESESRRIDCDTINNIYECMLSVRREASCTYAGLGDKYASDVNRNAYLDLLRGTRLNKQTESRMVVAQRNAARLHFWLVVSLLLVAVVILVVSIINIRWKRRHIAYVTDLNRLFKVCRMLMSSLPQQLPDAAAVHSAVCKILNSELNNFSGETRLSILPINDCAGSNTTCMPLVLMDGTSRWALSIETQIPLTSTKRSLFGILLPYIAVAIDEGMRIVDIGDERTRLQQKQQSYSIYLASHKRENVIKRVSLSVVNGMTPYINRILNELSRLSAAEKPGETEYRRLDYIAELIAVLDEHNTVLERWIKMKHGELNLHIESFAVNELFAILKNSTQGFLLKGIDFYVKETTAVVKADKSLTLFMINTLAENAGKFTPRGGKVTVEALEDEDFVEIAVTDTGCGMNNEDINSILNNKVYDASSIGRDAPLSMNKGSGFGLMNCKGIIEKYRKSDALFSVCSLDISSEKGKGSRFSFRLPKGVIRTVAILLFVLFPLKSTATTQLFDEVNMLADSVYLCNVDGKHSEALQYAENAITLLNEYYCTAYPEGRDTLAFASGNSAELQWWRLSLFPDSLTEGIYYNLLDIRNETAVAALALRQWQLYRYNNNIYTRLYRMVHEDKELVQHYEQMQSIANYRYAAVAVCGALLVVLLVVSVIMYMRHILLEKMNILMLLGVNSRLLNVARSGRMTDNSLAGSMAAEIYAGTHEYLRVQSVALLLKNGSYEQVAASPHKIERRTEIFLNGVFDSGEFCTSNDGRVCVLPLVAKASHKEKTMGVLYFEFDRMLTTSEISILELIASYAASTAYYSIVSLVENYRSLEDEEEEAVRLKYEENYLHVRNMVIDNCLSMIKHETIYYPPRLSALVDKLRTQSVPVSEWGDRVAVVKELMTYYNQIFTLLSRCASRQLDDAGFTASRISLEQLCCNMQRYVTRKAKREGISVSLQCDVKNVATYADEVLVEFLFCSLFDALLARKADGTLYINAVEDNNMLRVEILDSRYHLTPEELTNMFVPDSRGIASVEYLIVKEIIRMHEDYMDIRGSRVEAHDSPRGTVILFTLPPAR